MVNCIIFPAACDPMFVSDPSAEMLCFREHLETSICETQCKHRGSSNLKQSHVLTFKCAITWLQLFLLLSQSLCRLIRQVQRVSVHFSDSGNHTSSLIIPLSVSLQNTFLPANTEEDIFAHLGLEYVEPWQRNA